MSIIRKSKIEDSQRLEEFVKDMIGDENKDEVAKSVVEDFFVNNRYRVFVTEIQHVIISFGVLKYEPYEGASGIAEIVWLGTDENNKRKGLASRLVKYIENYSKERAIRKLYVKTSSNNKIANCFWIMQGYKFESRMLDFSMIGHDDYYLGKVLSDEIC